MKKNKRELECNLCTEGNSRSPSLLLLTQRDLQRHHYDG